MIPIVSEDFHIPSDTPGIELFMRNKHRSDAGAPCAERTVLFVHGSSYPVETAFDMPLAGVSWMDWIAERGFDAWVVDVRGYGLSTRPPEMDQPAADNAPVVRTDVAVRDVATAVHFILAQRDLAQLCVVGWSWGTTLMGAYTAANGETVHKLVLLAPQWLHSTSSASDAGGRSAPIAPSRKPAPGNDGCAAYRPRSKQVFCPRVGSKCGKRRVGPLTLGAMQAPPVLRAPNGTVQDSREFWSARKPVYDLGRIRAPVLIVHAEWDQDLPLDMARTYFSLLTNARYRRWVEIAAAGSQSNAGVRRSPGLSRRGVRLRQQTPGHSTPQDGRILHQSAMTPTLRRIPSVR